MGEAVRVGDGGDGDGGVVAVGEGEEVYDEASRVIEQVQKRRSR